MIVLPLNELNFFFSILQYSLFSFPLKGFSFGLKSSRCVCVCCIELTVGITIYEIEKNSYHLLSHRAVWIRWNMSLWMFLSNLDWSFFIFFLSCVHTLHAMEWDWSNQPIRHTLCFQCRRHKIARLQFGALTRITPGWGGWQSLCQVLGPDCRSPKDITQDPGSLRVSRF